ncbi:hypothetical protein N7478_000454 [Penicillium angulare]|uniref:uncharacterized protein n=1 Tax=Penicillium angulare TaxID=116970 RepID=UPI002540DB19|nr:uncharacterized protein N7478_000454 [Penicillium angulare]KAJ5291203.1 hypothetical protein N7478_000454 [Penicillium angulare]
MRFTVAPTARDMGTGFKLGHNKGTLRGLYCTQSKYCLLPSLLLEDDPNWQADRNHILLY